MTTDFLDRIEDYLQRERQLLRAGDLAALADHQLDRDHVFAGLAAFEHAAEAGRLRKIRARMDANIRLAGAAADGIRAAMGRLRELTRAAGPIGSYGADGRREQIGTIRPTCERKA